MDFWTFVNAQEFPPYMKRKQAENYLYEALPLLRKAWIKGEQQYEGKAIALVKKATQEDPNYADALSVLAQIYAMQDKCAEVKKLDARISDLEVKNIDRQSDHFAVVTGALVDMCGTYNNLSPRDKRYMFDSKKRDFFYLIDVGKMKLKEINKHYHNYVGFYEKDKYKEMEKELKKILKIYPLHIDALFALGEAYYDQVKWKEAVAMLKKVIPLSPIFSDSVDHTPFYYIGYCYFHLGKKEEAMKYFKKHLKLFPKDYEAKGMIRALEKKTK